MIISPCSRGAVTETEWKLRGTSFARSRQMGSKLRVDKRLALVGDQITLFNHRRESLFFSIVPPEIVKLRFKDSQRTRAA